MTAEPFACPDCQAALRSGARFCAHCGLEVCAPCPGCGGAPRWLVGMGPAPSPWCGGCAALLNRCEGCSRWLLPSTGSCPNPACESRALPLLPQHTGRRWDGRGSAVEWCWPSRWDQWNPQWSAPLVWTWASEEALHAAFVAHGRLFVWEGTRLVAIPEKGVWHAADPRANASTLTAAGDDTAWRCPLGVAGRPAAALPFSERVAVTGAGAVLALERGYLLVDLGGSGGTARLEGGKPIGQVGGPGWWAGWSEEEGRRLLRVASVGDAWDALVPQIVATSPEAELAQGGRMVLLDGQAWWPGKAGGIWRLAIESESVERVVDSTGDLLMVLAEKTGPQVAQEAGGQVSLCLPAPANGREALLARVAAGPLRGLFSSSGWTVVVGDRLTVLDPISRQKIHEAARLPGQWVAGALAPAPGGEPRLLALTKEDPFARLTAQRISSGTTELLWEEADVDLEGLLAVGPDLYVAHRRGVARLREWTG